MTTLRLVSSFDEKAQLRPEGTALPLRTGEEQVAFIEATTKAKRDCLIELLQGMYLDMISVEKAAYTILKDWSPSCRIESDGKITVLVSTAE